MALPLLALAAATVLCAPAACASPLKSLPRTFLSTGVVKSSDNFYYDNIPCIYLEPATITKAPYAWAAQHQCAYLYQVPQWERRKGAEEM